VATPEELENRIERLEQLASKFTTIATRTYIALLSIPRELRDKDPDFDKSLDEISNKLDEVFAIFKKKESET
jgi:hypothetical protein